MCEFFQLSATVQRFQTDRASKSLMLSAADTSFVALAASYQRATSCDTETQKLSFSALNSSHRTVASHNLSLIHI